MVRKGREKEGTSMQEQYYGSILFILDSKRYICKRLKLPLRRSGGRDIQSVKTHAQRSCNFLWKSSVHKLHKLDLEPGLSYGNLGKRCKFRAYSITLLLFAVLTVKIKNN